jgi:hypothetical protein
LIEQWLAYFLSAPTNQGVVGSILPHNQMGQLVKLDDKQEPVDDLAFETANTKTDDDAPDGEKNRERCHDGGKQPFSAPRKSLGLTWNMAPTAHNPDGDHRQGQDGRRGEHDLCDLPHIPPQQTSEDCQHLGNFGHFRDRTGFSALFPRFMPRDSPPRPFHAVAVGCTCLSLQSNA